jgi:hypothetical protein
MGRFDRLLRLILAIVLGGLFFLTQVSLYRWIIVIGTGFLLFEYFSRWCAFNALIGRNTCNTDFE